uniref:Uncharacterized protein n=1 Tax=Globodera pallida TaxID=36090 RepID=A0A183C878_GLOPA
MQCRISNHLYLAFSPYQGCNRIPDILVRAPVAWTDICWDVAENCSFPPAADRLLTNARAVLARAFRIWDECEALVVALTIRGNVAKDWAKKCIIAFVVMFNLLMQRNLLPIFGCG